MKINKAAIIIVNLILALLMGLSGCITINPPAALTSTPTPVPTAPIPTPTPQLIELSFSLSVQPPQEYALYTIPIYIRSHQTLYLHWQVIQGRSFWMSCITPRGDLIGARVDGDFNIYSICEELVGMGTIIFSPSDPKYTEVANKLGEGYYVFHPNISKGAVMIKVQYWIEG